MQQQGLTNPGAETMALKVLIADDDPLARSLITTTVLRAGAEVTEVADGLEAWGELRKGGYAAAIIDLEMPSVDGFEVISCLRGHPETKHIPVIVITSRDDKRAIERAQNAGATTYITKPVHWTAFRAHILHILELVARTSSRREPDLGPICADLEQVAKRLDDMAQQVGTSPLAARAQLKQAAALLRIKAHDLSPPPAMEAPVEPIVRQAAMGM